MRKMFALPPTTTSLYSVISNLRVRLDFSFDVYLLFLISNCRYMTEREIDCDLDVRKKERE